MRRYGGGRAFLLAYRQFDRSSVESIIEKRFQDLAAEGLEAEALALVIATGKQLHAPTRTNEWRAARWGSLSPGLRSHVGCIRRHICNTSLLPAAGAVSF